MGWFKGQRENRPKWVDLPNIDFLLDLLWVVSKDPNSKIVGSSGSWLVAPRDCPVLLTRGHRDGQLPVPEGRPALGRLGANTPQLYHVMLTSFQGPQGTIVGQIPGCVCVCVSALSCTYIYIYIHAYWQAVGEGSAPHSPRTRVSKYETHSLWEATNTQIKQGPTATPKKKERVLHLSLHLCRRITPVEMKAADRGGNIDPRRKMDPNQH